MVVAEPDEELAFSDLSTYRKVYANRYYDRLDDNADFLFMHFHQLPFIPSIGGSASMTNVRNDIEGIGFRPQIYNGFPENGGV